MKVTDNEIAKARKSQFYSRYIKRGIDLIISFLLLVILWPLFLILAGWIKLDSSGPVFFCQERMEKNGRPFKIYKFRSSRCVYQVSYLKDSVKRTIIARK